MWESRQRFPRPVESSWETWVWFSTAFHPPVISTALMRFSGIRRIAFVWPFAFAVPPPYRSAGPLVAAVAGHFDSDGDTPRGWVWRAKFPWAFDNAGNNAACDL